MESIIPGLAARNYSARQPLNFQTRREAYQRYLDRHPGGASAAEARTAVVTIDADWDRHDFRAVRDHFPEVDVLRVANLA